MRRQLQLHLFISSACLVCLSIILLHGHYLSKTVQTSTSKVNDKMNDFDNVMLFVKTTLEVIAKDSKQMFEDVNNLVSRLHELSVNIELQLHQVDNATQRTRTLCNNETFQHLFQEFTSSICL